MCTIAILFGVAEPALVLATNRDELYERKTRGPELLLPGLIGGVDEVSGGTWMAVRADGQFAAVTNQRVMEPPPVGLRSRGLVVRELAAAADQDAYIAALDPREYAAMNLVWGDATRVFVGYLRRDGTKDIQALPKGVHVLANDRIGAPGFPRAERFHAAIERALAAGTRSWPAIATPLATGLADHTRVEPEPSTLPPDIARELTATCIHTEKYGTRSATIVAMDPGKVLGYLHADGKPCTTPFLDRTALFQRKRTLVVAGLIIGADGRVLITQRRADQALGLQWEFPGGKVEPGEDPRDALVRELREEIGVEVEVGRVWDVLFHAYPAFDLVMPVYACRIVSGEPRAVEVADLTWVRPDELARWDILPADRPLVERLASEGLPI